MKIKALFCGLAFMLLSVSAISGRVYADTVTYSYDNLNRLINVQYANGTVIDYAYDAAGNRLSLLVATPEICDGIDNDLDGQIDEGVQNTYYRDADSDTYGNASVTTQACSQPLGYVSNNTDCNDSNAFINPGAAETCNGVDDNCNTQIDEGYNQDGDGYTTCAGDCDDNNASIYPGAAEVCNSVDDNCNTQIDEGVQNTYYWDADSDTYGNASLTTQACSPPSGYVTSSTDCNDSNASIYPGALEVCNSVDDNCNTQIDENVMYSYYVDADGDGYGDPANSTVACSQPTGYVSDNTDCDDSDANIYPGATEIPNDGIDQDCNGGDLGAEALLSNAPSGDQRFPWADYNEATSEYLVLWQDKRSGANDDIYGVRLDVDGNRIGSDFPVSSAAGHQQRVQVTAGGGGYLAVWHDLRNQSANGADIYGAWIAGDGTVGPEMAICACAKDQWNPVAGYDPVSNMFLVVWLDARGSVNNQGANPNDDLDLYGVVIPAGGSQSLTPFTVVSANNGQRGPQIGYDYGNHQYYLAWNDRRSGVNYDIYGSRVTTTGALLDGMGVLLSGASGNQFRPTVTDRRPSAGINNHLVSWADYRNGAQGDVYGIYVDGSGAPVGSEIAISTSLVDQANVVADVDWINTKKSLVGFIDNTPGAYYNINTALVDQSGLSTENGPVAANVDEQRAEVVTYATDGTTDYGFLAVWMDRRNGADYDIWGIKVWP